MSDPGALEEWCKLNGCYEAIFGKPNEEQTKRVAEEQKRQKEVKQKKLTEEKNKKNAENALNKFVRVDNQDTNDTPVVPEKGLKKYRSGILGLQYLKNLRTKMVQFFSRGRKE